MLFIKASDSPNGSPLLIVSNELSGTNATVSWQPNENDGGEKVLKYVVTSTPSGAGCTTTDVECTVTGLKRGVGYRFSVAAVSATDRGKSAVTVVKVGRTLTGTSILKGAQVTVVSGARVTVKVAASSAKYCRVLGTAVKGVKAGTCRVTVTMTPKKGKTVTKTVNVKVA